MYYQSVFDDAHYQLPVDGQPLLFSLKKVAWLYFVFILLTTCTCSCWLVFIDLYVKHFELHLLV